MKRGDVYLANLGPIKGSEQAGTRPVLIFQNNLLNKTARTVVVIPFTTNLRMACLPSCTQVPAGEGGLHQDSVAICHQIRALDKTGLLTCWGTLPPMRLVEIEQVVTFTLGIGG